MIKEKEGGLKSSKIKETFLKTEILTGIPFPIDVILILYVFFSTPNVHNSQILCPPLTCSYCKSSYNNNNKKT